MLNDKFTQLEVSAFADSTIDQFPQLPSLFQHHVLFQNILGVAFIDAGAAWDHTRDLKLVHKFDGKLQTQDMLVLLN